MGETLNKIAIQITESMFELWNKAQVIVALTRTKIGKNVIIVGDIQETINAIITFDSNKKPMDRLYGKYIRSHYSW